MWIRKGQKYVFMDQANAGEGGGGSAAGTGPEGSTGGDTGGQAGAGGDDSGGAAAGSAPAAGDQGSVLQQAGQNQQPLAIPEKFQVKKEDGSLDFEASALKLAENYSHLEKRMGAGDAPPKSADDYQVAVPDVLKDSWNPKEDPILGEFLKDAHAAGMTQKQVDLALQKYLDIVPDLINGSQSLSAEECTADLKKEWATPEVYEAEVKKAYKAAVSYGGDDADAILKDYGNDPRIIRMLSRIGGEMTEDSSFTPPGGGIPAGQTVDTLMMSEAYNNPKHPDHATVSRQVAEHYRRLASAAEKSGNVPIL